MILTGNIQTSSTAPHLQGDLILDESYPLYGPRFEAWEKVAAAAKAGGALLLGQLSYPGRQALASVARKTVIAPSVVPFGQNSRGAATQSSIADEIIWQLPTRRTPRLLAHEKPLRQTSNS